MRLTSLARRIKPKRQLSIFDIPTDAYNPKTGLPYAIRIGEQVLAPLIQIQQVQDYLIVLGAFDQLINQSPSLPQLAQQSALQYQLWAQAMLPYYQRRRARRDGGIVKSDSGTTLSDERSTEGKTAVLSDAAWTHSPAIVDDGAEWLERDSTMLFGSMSPERSNTASTDRTAVSYETDVTLVDDPPRLHASVPSRWTSKATDAELHDGEDATVVRERERMEEEDQFLPPLNVLFAWHSHTMRSEKYARDIEPDNAYASLCDYPFPLREVAQAIIDGTLPDLLAVQGPYQKRQLESTTMDPLDIASAMQYDAPFIRDVKRGGWLERQDTESANHVVSLPLHRLVLQYHAWLDLIRATGDPSLVFASHDIELVWRVHRLDTARYIDETEQYTGLCLGDFRVAARRDESTIHRTKKLWKSMFGIPFQEKIES